MKSLFKVLSLAAALTVSAAAAHADPVNGIISINGADNYNSTNITFVGNGTTQAVLTAGTLTNLFAAGDTSMAPVSLTSFNFDGGFVPTQVFSVTHNGVTVSLMLNSITTVTNDSTGLNIIGNGVLSETGYTPAAGVFKLTTQDGGTGATVSFSATTVAPTPEPNSLMLLGTGLVSSAGMLYRRRRNA